MTIDLRAERMNRGLTLSSAAKQMAITESALSLIERQMRTPTAPVAFRIASFYGYRVTDVWPSFPTEQEAA